MNVQGQSIPQSLQLKGVWEGHWSELTVDCSLRDQLSHCLSSLMGLTVHKVSCLSLQWELSCRTLGMPGKKSNIVN